MTVVIVPVVIVAMLFFFLLFLDKVLELVSEGSVTNGEYPVQFVRSDPLATTIQYQR